MRLISIAFWALTWSAAPQVIAVPYTTASSQASESGKFFSGFACVQTIVSSHVFGP